MSSQRPSVREGVGRDASHARRNRLLWLVPLVAAGAALLVITRVGPSRHAAPPAPLSEPLIERGSPPENSEARFRLLLQRYAETEHPCELPPVEHMVDWHAARFLHGPAAPGNSSVGAQLHETLRPAGVRVAYSAEPQRGYPWVTILPEYHGREASEALVSRLATLVASATGAPRTRVFVEAWSSQVHLPERTHGKAAYSGCENPQVYAASRAAWSLLDLIESQAEPRFDALAQSVAAALLSDEHPRLLVGQHASRAGAHRAISQVEQFWDAMTTQLAGLEVSRVTLPAGADYLTSSGWRPLHRDIRVAAPAALGAYRRSSRLHFLAQTVAAITSRIRTTECALQVLDTLAQRAEVAALVQIGANHIHPLLEVLQRAGVGVAILLGPQSKNWPEGLEPWRCPSTKVGTAGARGLGYFRLPGRALERKQLRPWELLTRSGP